MSLTKHATFKVLAARIATEGAPLMRTAHRAEFDYTPKPGFLYVRSRAISSRVNDNFDGFGADEIKAAYRTFIGKPVFVNHHNADHRRARGVIIDAALHEDRNPDGSPDTWVEVLMEVDAIHFPKLAEAIVKGHIERTSMGTDVAYSICSACGNKASTPLDYCRHIPRMKGQRIYRTTASGTKEGVLVYEECHGLSFFENSLLVEEPADPTAFFLGVDTRGLDARTAAILSGKTSAVRSEPGLDSPRQSRPSLASPSGQHPTPGERVPVSASSSIKTAASRRTALRWTMAPPGVECVDCLASNEDVPASYILEDGTPVCDSHLEIRTEDERDRLARPEWYGITPEGHRLAAVASKTALLPGETEDPVIAPEKVDTLRDEKCPVCGEEDAFDGQECQVCGFIAPPDEFGDPDVEKAKQVDLRQDTDDAAGVSGGALRCDSCGATFADADAAPAKTALVLDKDKGKDSDQGSVDVQAKAGDTCPTCGQGTLQVVSPGADGKGSGNFAPAGSAPKTIDQDKFAPAGSAAKQGSKAPLAARRAGSQKEESMRPALVALAEQQQQIKTLLGENDSLKKAVAFIATAAGVESHPVITAALRPRVAVNVQDNPGAPTGWAIDPKGTEAPTVTSTDAVAPEGKDDPTNIGASPVTNVAPAAVTDPTTIQTVLDTPLDLNPVDVTEPVAGTNGEGAGQPGTNTDEVDVRIGNPDNPQKAFDDGGFLSTGGRTIASLRLARLQIQAGVASGDDLVLGQQIAASKATDATIQTQIETLTSVLAARPAAAAPSRRLVPQAEARTAVRSTPVISATAGAAPEPILVGHVSEDELAFE